MKKRHLEIKKCLVLVNYHKIPLTIHYDVPSAFLSLLSFLPLPGVYVHIKMPIVFL